MLVMMKYNLSGQWPCTSCDSMERILERYERYSYAERQLVATDSETQPGNWSLEYPKLVSKIEVLQRNHRHYLGNDLDPLSLRELQHLEQQLDTALKRIRTRKNQLMHDSIVELQKKEKALQEQNNVLLKKLKENEKTLAERAQWEQNVGQNSAPLMLLPQTSLPLTIGRPFQGRGAIVEDGAQSRPSNNTLMPPWMLRHLHE
ncbi:Transcription factor, K-box [Dillenia turbinata]|uniref:Transcription factor, K-box n=1 Tax=Dillenia turbinata TaxID=194707 RepID=A0AAN8V799_9MAGN